MNEHNEYSATRESQKGFESLCLQTDICSD